jgi:decaprenylphospho-beta-D-erythro-pentofuranosid-2-ulose 2-reductase
MKASSMLKIMILGATSAIAHETARNFARDGAQFFLVARNTDKLNAISSDLQAFGAGQVACATVDLNDTSAHAGLIDSALGALGGLDAVILCYGTLPDQPAVEKDYDAAVREFQTNFLSSMSFLTVAGNFFEKQRRGVITVVSSVAGDRGRASNYVYGSAMAAKTAFVSGLRNRLARSGVQVVTVKPGLVDTPMTADMKKGLIWADASTVGQDIYTAMKQGRDVVYTPWFWRYIMTIIRLIPERIFKRLSL